MTEREFNAMVKTKMAEVRQREQQREEAAIARRDSGPTNGNPANGKPAAAMLNPPLPKPLFDVGFAVDVPTEVSDSRTAKIVGRAWGPNEREGKSNGWIYLLSFPLGNGFWSPRFMASEAELVGWQGKA